MDQEQITSELQKFNIADAAIAEMSSQFMLLSYEKDGYDVVHKAKMVVKGKRVEVEKKRKELKEDALRYGQAIDGEAKRITALIAPIEDHLSKEEEQYLSIEAAKKAEKERLLAEKLQARVERLCSFGATFDGTMFKAYGVIVAHKALSACSDEGFDQFIDQIVKAKDAADALLAAEAEVRKQEEERIAQIKKEQESEKARLDAIAKEQADKEAKLRLEREAIDREKQRVIDEAAAKERDRIRAVELEIAKAEAAEKAVREAKEKEARDRAEAEAKAEKARIAAERKAARLPDKEKIIAYLTSISNIQIPTLKNSEALALMVDIDQKIRETLSWSQEKAGEL